MYSSINDVGLPSLFLSREMDKPRDIYQDQEPSEPTITIVLQKSVGQFQQNSSQIKDFKGEQIFLIQKIKVVHQIEGIAQPPNQVSTFNCSNISYVQ